MQLDPPLKKILDLVAGNRPAEPGDMAQRRAQGEAAFGAIRPAPQTGVTVADHTVAVEGGQILVRTYIPDDLARPAPVLFYLHGGGWFMGNLDTAESECVIQAADIPAVMVSVDYRLAPEHKFPIPFDDCMAAYGWVLAQADELGVDTGRIAVAGGSAGANLAAAMCLAIRDRGLPLPCLQLLDVPFVDLTLGSPSLTEEMSGYGLTGSEVLECAEIYVRDEADRRHPYVSPLLAEDLSGLPPAFILTAEFDPVRDDGERYLERLHQAGVAAAGFRVLSHIHGTWVIPGSATWGLVRDVRLAALRRAFDGTLAPELPF
ncbi:MAG TPA: alpha/beta hydrolase [Acidimicrobiales bacterium]|jgi:acetyl esterase|nr:alpha/beta hydrolase [Acidimicrobiales bacterium]